MQHSIATLMLFALAAAVVSAQVTPPQDAVERLLRAQHASADWFVPSFLAQVPLEQIDAVIEGMRSQAGHFERVELRDGTLYAIFANGESKTQVALDSQGRFTGLIFGPVVVKVATLEQALNNLRASSGESGYLVLKNNEQLAALEPDRPMAVGSTFKLAVLAALRNQIDARKRRWSDVVPLDPAFKSLPSGILQEWPDGMPLTLASYAAEMISISDNTAADALIHVVGRDSLEALGPRNIPFLTTREMFVLKTMNSALQAAFRRSSAQARRAMLPRIDAEPLPAPDALDTDPVLLDIEWYFTPRELCTFMARVEDLPLMAINSGVTGGSWRRVAYKGGSDWGVLNFTSYLTANDGTTYCVTATWNNSQTPVDQATAAAAFSSLLDYLTRR